MIKFAIFDFIYTLAPTNIEQSVPNLATVYMPVRSRMSSIMGQIELEHPEVFALEFVYNLASTCTNINHSAPNLVKMYVAIRSRMSLITDLIVPELSELFALEFAEISESDFVHSLAPTNVNELVPNMVTIYI